MSDKNGKLAVPVNSTLVCHMTFLAADTWLCILILGKQTFDLNLQLISLFIIYRPNIMTNNCEFECLSICKVDLLDFLAELSR